MQDATSAESYLSSRVFLPHQTLRSVYCTVESINNDNCNNENTSNETFFNPRFCFVLFFILLNL